MHTSNQSSTPRGTPSRRGRSPRVSSPGPIQPSSSSMPSHASGSSPSFFSCLSIPVEGAIPIEDLEDNSPTAKPMSSATDSQRAPRKSKTEAMNALNAHAKSTIIDIDETQPLAVLAERYENSPPIPVSPFLDLSSVKTPKTERQPPVRAQEPRPFGLEDCPEYHPTVEEFKDPMAYIKSISNKAREHGICKIIPPDGWKMPFVTDTERFRFKTRVQRLNSIEASSRAKVNFLEQLYRFHKQQGNPRIVVPTVNHKPLDLWLLRKEVQKQGGYEAVNKAKKWLEMARMLGYRGAPGLATQLKNSYARIILPYEDFCERGKNLPTTPPRPPQKKSNTGTPSKLGRLSVSASNPAENSAPSSPLTTTSSPLSEPPDEGDSKEQSTARLRRSTRQASQDRNSPKKVPLPTPALTPPVFNDKDKPAMEQHCEICGKMNYGEKMLLCDGCDCGFHMFCLNPPLNEIPNEQWFCYTCLSGTGGDYGFDEGEEHSLSSFQARDLEFRRLWFKTHPPPLRPDRMDVDVDPRTCNKFDNIIVTENDVENEFWRLVQSPDDTVEIEYGADVHSTTHGSAMPTLETHPLDPYSKDPWNLNNIPVLSDSLLRFIKSDISGMTVPWTYVGMAFSTFCWHNEDHYTYSVNFMHWGETKTWYGIPGDDAEKFEAAIRYEAPDLFEAQPDLLFQLVTLMNPKRLIDAGVRVSACNQRAGELVLTFPKAYHAGFNHGLNFNEAVNFALPEWLSYGRDCVQRYRAFRKLPVFSHDELLITITQQSPSIKTALWLTESLQEMTDREMDNRRKARALLMRETLEEQDRPEDQYQCAICKVFCYLSQITCPCSTKVVCVEHADLLCTRPKEQHLALRKRFSDEELLDIQVKVAERAQIPTLWKAKLHKLLMESPRPALRQLRALLSEGERIHIHYSLPEFYTLRKCVNRANEWVEAANSFTRKQPSRKRSRRSVKGRPNDLDEGNEKPEKTLSDLYGLLREVERLGFDCPEIANLRSLGQQAERAITRATALLDPAAIQADNDKYLVDCNSLIVECSSLNLLLHEVSEVEKVVDREQLLSELRDKIGDGYNATLDEVRQYLARGRACNLPLEHEYMRWLENGERAGGDWETTARSLLAKPVKTIEELDEFMNPPADTPIDPVLSERIDAIRCKGKEFEKIANTWLVHHQEDAKPRPQEVLKVASRAEKEFNIDAMMRIKGIALVATELEMRCEQVLKGTYRLRPNENVFSSIKDWRDYANEHLKLFSLPTFEKLEVQLNSHNQWQRSLPWWCNKHDAPHVKPVMDDVLSCTRPEDDRPPDDEYFTCICNAPVKPPPPGVVSDAVQCDHCYARFHGECAKNGGSCPFCDHHHWNGDIPKERSWHFCYLPQLLVMAPEITKRYSQDWKDLETIVVKVDRLSQVIGHFLAYQSREENQRSAYIHQVRHYMRKLYKLQFVVSPTFEISFGLDLASLHRMLAQRPPKTKKKRAKVTFGQDIDPVWADGTRCICRGRSPYLVNYPTVACEGCERLYHAACVFFPMDSLPDVRRKYQCPLCCLRKNKVYRYSDVRVQPSSTEGRHPDIYVNWTEMLEASSRDIIYMTLPKPYRETLFVELVRYIPASDGTTSSPSSTPGPNDRNHTHRNASTVNLSVIPQHSIYDNPRHAPVPPPPWSRWSAAAASDMASSTSNRRFDEPPRKRQRHENERSTPDDHPPMASLLHEPLSHRTTLPPASSIAEQHPVSSFHRPSPHNNQSLSPSLARLMSPVDQPSPHPTYATSPTTRNGSSHDPLRHSPSMRNGIEVRGSPPMRGLGDSPKLMRNKIDTPTLPPIRDALNASPRIRNGGLELTSYGTRNAVDLYSPNGHTNGHSMGRP
ncbi:hypothetical protein E1B28_004748 [Marasmius oreades]|uniref:[histone H3]-trimethyl-L-lysine(4) demethylase n=1 Tax=Marasmius oreades TaxID=181124 RepID=A0A9P7UZD0_9AGAR|nr:uncharacterized protein E1B28_004748 [Marasmius oreades]KAG7097398.1 hypothetical protein E1B28_004748 [Marasmius oreades]